MICGACGAEIIVARTEGGKRIRLDAEPAADGSIRVWETLPLGDLAKPGKLLAFFERFKPGKRGEESGYGYDAPRCSAREFFGHYRAHRCKPRAEEARR